jgi:hypothetical protein
MGRSKEERQLALGMMGDDDLTDETMGAMSLLIFSGRACGGVHTVLLWNFLDYYYDTLMESYLMKVLFFAQTQCHHTYERE